MNLHNFIVLFGLCKAPPAKFPKSAQEWIKYLKGLQMNVGGFFFNPLEIKHCLLRAALNIPKIYQANKDLTYPKYNEGDERLSFVYNKKNALINFGFSYPFKSSPRIKVYTYDKIYEQLKHTASFYLSKCKLEKSKTQLQLPGVIEMYEKDFIDTNEGLVNYIRTLLPSEMAEGYKKLFDSWYMLNGNKVVRRLYMRRSIMNSCSIIHLNELLSISL